MKVVEDVSLVVLCVVLFTESLLSAYVLNAW
jgi:hypothetical protein